MNAERVAIVEDAYVAWQSQDVDALVALLDPGIEWAPTVRFLQGRQASVGHDGVRRWFRHVRITWRTMRPIPEAFEEHDPHVLVAGRLVASSRLGEGDLDVRVWWVWTIRRGRITGMRAFREEQAARRALKPG